MDRRRRVPPTAPHDMTGPSRGAGSVPQRRRGLRRRESSLSDSPRSAPRARRRLTGVALCVATLALAACGSDDGGSEGGGGGGDGPTAVTLGYFPLVHTATAVQAEETGAFDDAGLDV